MKIVRALIAILLCSLVVVTRVRTESLTFVRLEQILFADTRTSEKCSKALGQLNMTEEWTLKMLDSWTKLQAGILYGNLADYGSFDECLEVDNSESTKTEDSLPIIGKHCFGKIPLMALLGALEQASDLTSYQGNVEHLPKRKERDMIDGAIAEMTWSACIPNHCTADDLNKLVSAIKIPVNFREENCQTREDVPEFTAGDIAASVFFGILLFMFVASTVYDTYLHYTKTESKHAILLAFSGLTNGRKLLIVNNNPSQLKCLDGLRFLSMMWVVLGHEYSKSVARPVFNAATLEDWLKRPISMYMLGATVSVDTFFVLSGLVMTYVFLSAMKKGVKFNIILYYVHRYIRLTPALAGMILLHVTLIKYLGSGPLWPAGSETLLIAPCRKSWWVPFVYLQNYIQIETMCVSQCWYLACDMQLFILSPLLLWPLSKWPKPTLWAVLALALGSTFWGFGVAWEESMVGLNLGYPFVTETQMIDTIEDYYMKTHTRAAPWFIGIILGYIIFKAKTEAPLRIHKGVAFLMWILSLTILAACVFAGHTLTMITEYDKFENVAYVAFVRPAWAIGLAWVIYACLFGYGGPINAFLSWNVFRIGSRFTYSMYIVHMTMLVIMNYSARVPMYINDYQVWRLFITDFTIILFISVFWTLIFESPMITIEKLLFKRGETKTKPAVLQSQPEVKVNVQ